MWSKRQSAQSATIGANRPNRPVSRNLNRPYLVKIGPIAMAVDFCGHFADDHINVKLAAPVLVTFRPTMRRVYGFSTLIAAVSGWYDWITIFRAELSPYMCTMSEYWLIFNARAQRSLRRRLRHRPRTPSSSPSSSPS